MTQIDVKYSDGRYRIGYANAVEIRRGNERLEKSRACVGPAQGWFCTLHGHQHTVNILDAGEVYPACKWCIESSSLIHLGDMEANVSCPMWPTNFTSTL